MLKQKKKISQQSTVKVLICKISSNQNELFLEWSAAKNYISFLNTDDTYHLKILFLNWC